MEFSIFLIFAGAAVLATLALQLRQALIPAYIILGVILGPWGASLVDDPKLIADISDVGIMFLLYLLGLDLLPQQLWKMLGEALWATLFSSLIFFGIGFGIALGFGYPLPEACLIGSVMMFSSTVIGVKLLPATILHQRHTGRIIISVLLLQDVVAIIILLLLQGYGKGGELALDIALQLLTLPMLILISWLFERYVLIGLLRRFDQVHEYIFLLAIAWCLAIAELAALMGLSHEIGAFIAGVTLASNPIALFITEKLKPLRDFFLVLFFFSLGASFNLALLPQIFMPALILALSALLIKPITFEKLFVRAGEKRAVSKEVGYRLGQISEFAFLIALLAVEARFIDERTSCLIQLATLFTLMISSSVVVLNYHTPVAAIRRMHRD